MSAIGGLCEACEKDIEEAMLSFQRLSEEVGGDASDRALAQTIAECEKKLAKAKKSRKNIGLEMQLIKDRVERSQYLAITNGFDEQLKKMTSDVQVAKMKKDKMELVQGAKNPYSTEGKDNDELLLGASKIQDLTFDSLGRTRLMIEQSKEIGSATVVELQRQRAQIAEIEEDVDTMESHVARAEKLVGNFTRRMASDKMIQGFMTLNIIIVIVIVIYAGVTGKTLSPKSSSRSGGGLFGTEPSPAPSFSPTMSPTVPGNPTPLPTYFPSLHPTLRPTLRPTLSPTRRPTVAPSRSPTCAPTFSQPTGSPSGSPTAKPTSMPSSCPTSLPSSVPTLCPTLSPTPAPTRRPTLRPSAAPTIAPTRLPTRLPSRPPSQPPSWSPTESPSDAPSPAPSISPTMSFAPTPS